MDGSPQPNACGVCDVAGRHTAADHPLAKDHPDYDAFFDATDAELAELAHRHLRATFGERP